MGGIVVKIRRLHRVGFGGEQNHLNTKLQQSIFSKYKVENVYF